MERKFGILIIAIVAILLSVTILPMLDVWENELIGNTLNCDSNGYILLTDDDAIAQRIYIPSSSQIEAVTYLEVGDFVPRISQGGMILGLSDTLTKDVQSWIAQGGDGPHGIYNPTLSTDDRSISWDCGMAGGLAVTPGNYYWVICKLDSNGPEVDFDYTLDEYGGSSCYFEYQTIGDGWTSKQPSDLMFKVIGGWRVNSDPIASFTYSPIAPWNGEVITFDGSDSYDLGGEIVGYSWDFGSGFSQYYTSPTTTHTYATYGTKTVTLKVKDDDDATDTMTKTIYVSDSGSTPPPPDTYHLTITTYDYSLEILPGVALSITPGSATGTTDVNGVKEFDLPSDTYEVRASKTGYIDKVKTIILLEDRDVSIYLDVDDGGSTPPDTYHVQLHITDTSDNPIEDATVSLINDDADFEMEDVTNEYGNAYFGSVPNGDYSVIIEHDDYDKKATIISVDGANLEKDIKVEGNFLAGLDINLVALLISFIIVFFMVIIFVIPQIPIPLALRIVLIIISIILGVFIYFILTILEVV